MLGSTHATTVVIDVSPALVIKATATEQGDHITGLGALHGPP